MVVFYGWPISSRVYFAMNVACIIFPLILGSVFSDCVVFYGDCKQCSASSCNSHSGFSLCVCIMSVRLCVCVCAWAGYYDRPEAGCAMLRRSVNCVYVSCVSICVCVRGQATVIVLMQALPCYRRSVNSQMIRNSLLNASQNSALNSSLQSSSG